jgi:hypothetical protein
MIHSCEAYTGCCLLADILSVMYGKDASDFVRMKSEENHFTAVLYVAIHTRRDRVWKDDLRERSG